MPDDAATRRALTAASRALRATAEERRALLAYQGTDEAHRAINRAKRGRPAPAWTIGLARYLDDLLDRSSIPVPVVVYRGLRNAPRYARVTLPWSEAAAHYVSTSLSQRVAEEFTERGRHPVLLRLEVPAGAAAVWVPPLGRRELVYERELLLPVRTTLRLGTRRYVAGTLVVEGEVIA